MSYTLGVDTLNQKLTADHTEGKIGSWVNDPGDVGNILVGKSSEGVGAVIKIVGASTPGIWDYEVLLGTSSDILNGFWYPNVYRVLLDVGGTDADDEYFYYDNGIGPYPWPGETAPPPAGSYQYFRISISANGGNANFTALQEIELATYEGGSDITEAGMFTLSSSNDTDRGPENLINNNRVDLDESWMTADGSPAPSWWYVNTLSFNHVTELRMLAKNNAEAVTRAPMDFDVEGSNDGSNWTIIQSITGETWTQGEEKSFIIGVSPPTLNPISNIEVDDGDLPQNYDMSTYLVSDGGEAVVYSIEIAAPPAVAYQYYRLFITGNNDVATVIAIQEIELATTPAGPDITSPGLPTDESYSSPGREAARIIENSFTVNEQGYVGTIDPNAYPWVSVDTQGSYVIEELRMWAQDHVNGPGNAPSSFNFEGSNDGTNWTIIKNFLDITGWVQAGSKTFDVTPIDPPSAGEYRYIKIDITAGGDGTYSAIQEIEVASSPGGTDLTAPGMPGWDQSSAASTDREANKTIDNDITNNTEAWISAASQAIPSWIVIDLQVHHTLSELSIWSQVGAGARAPEDFDVSGSLDGTNWTLIKSFTGEVGWGSAEKRIFDLTPAVQLLAEDITINSSTGSLTVADTTSIDTHATTMTVTNSQGQASEDFDIIVSEGGGAISYQHFRIYVHTNNGDPTYTSILEIELATNPGGADITSPGMATTESSVLQPRDSSKAIDNVFVGNDYSWTSTTANNQYITVDTAGSFQVTELRMWAANEAAGPARAPKDFDVEGSNDGTNWDIIKSLTNVTGWTNAGSKTFDLTPSEGGPYQHIKIFIYSNNGSTYSSIQEIELATTPAGADVTSPGMPTDQSSFLNSNYLAVEIIADTFVDLQDSWISSQGKQNNSFVAVDLQSPTDITELRIWAQNEADGVNRAPMDFDVEGSNGDSNWDTIKSFTGVTGWVPGGSKTFDLVNGVEVLAAIPAYQHYKIDISANNGALVTAIRAIEGRYAPSGNDSTAPGMACLASSTLASYTAAGVVDNLGTGWASAIGQGSPSWWSVDTGSQIEVREVEIWAQILSSGAERAPMDFDISGSNDGSNWTVIKSFVGVDDWVVGGSKVFDLT